MAQTRREILAAAAACDFPALERLASSGTRPFTYSFGDDSDPAGYWRRQEAAGEQPLRYLTGVLGLTYRFRSAADQYAWPAAYGYDRWQDVPQAAKDELRGLYSEEDLDRFATFGSYAGYRVGIAPDGEWLFFVAGD